MSRDNLNAVFIFLFFIFESTAVKKKGGGEALCRICRGFLQKLKNKRFSLHIVAGTQKSNNCPLLKSKSCLKDVCGA